MTLPPRRDHRRQGDAPKARGVCWRKRSCHSLSDGSRPSTATSIWEGKGLQHKSHLAVGMKCICLKGAPLRCGAEGWINFDNNTPTFYCHSLCTAAPVTPLSAANKSATPRKCGWGCSSRDGWCSPTSRFRPWRKSKDTVNQWHVVSRPTLTTVQQHSNHSRGSRLWPPRSGGGAVSIHCSSTIVSIHGKLGKQYT